MLTEISFSSKAEFVNKFGSTYCLPDYAISYIPCYRGDLTTYGLVPTVTEVDVYAVPYSYT
jgi:hypothetical protein